MSFAEVLTAAGLIRPVKPRAFCPACRVHVSVAAGAGAEVELARPAVVALLFLAAAAVAWFVAIGQARAMGSTDMGLAPIESFASGWFVMMAAMMLPSALPLVFRFAQAAEGRRGWQAAPVALGASYLGVWLAFGVACYALYGLLRMPSPHQAIAGGLALVAAALYGLTPMKRASEARCRELCALHGPLPFSLLRGALLSGAKYGLSCVGCSAGLMVAALIIGMSNLAWMLVIGAVVVLYKLAPGAGRPRALLFSTALAALGLIYVSLG
jgi:predicted metal-binding membrane protein